MSYFWAFLIGIAGHGNSFRIDYLLGQVAFRYWVLSSRPAKGESEVFSEFLEGGFGLSPSHLGQRGVYALGRRKTDGIAMDGYD